MRNAKYPLSVRATAYCMYRMHVFTTEEVRSKILEKYNMDIPAGLVGKWCSGQNAVCIKKNLHLADPEVYKQYLITQYKQALLVHSDRTIDEINNLEGKEVSTALKTMAEGIKLLTALEKQDNFQDVLPDENIVVKNFARMLGLDVLDNKEKEDEQTESV